MVRPRREQHGGCADNHLQDLVIQRTELFIGVGVLPPLELNNALLNQGFEPGGDIVKQRGNGSATKLNLRVLVCKSAQRFVARLLVQQEVP